jgi:hypothetical protein
MKCEESQQTDKNPERKVTASGLRTLFNNPPTQASLNNKTNWHLTLTFGKRCQDFKGPHKHRETKQVNNLKTKVSFEHIT